MTPTTQPQPITCNHCTGTVRHLIECTRPLYPRIEWFGKLQVHQPASVHTAMVEASVMCA